MKKFTLLFSFLFYVAFVNAQMKVDSLGRTSLGIIPEETFNKAVVANTTIYNGENLSTLNLYCAPTSTIPMIDKDVPFFIQCINGNTNEVDSEGGTQPILTQEFHRVFYVDSDGRIYSKGGLIYEAVDPRPVTPFGKVQKAQSGISALSRLEGINGVSYMEDNISDGGATLMSTGYNGRTRLGLLAEEVEKTVPEAVVTLDGDKKGISYSDLVVVLIDAVNELSGEVKRLKEELESSQMPVEMRMSPSSINSLDLNQTYISQNMPNPFNQETIIEYGLSDEISNAFIYIYDMQGKQIKCYDLSEKQGKITINASELEAGMYIYSLIADGREVKSYRMILTK